MDLTRLASVLVGIARTIAALAVPFEPKTLELLRFALVLGRKQLMLLLRVLLPRRVLCIRFRLHFLELRIELPALIFQLLQPSLEIG